MRHLSSKNILFVLSCCISIIAITDLYGQSSLQELLDKKILVETKLIKIEDYKPDPLYATYTFEITHVYCGSGVSVGMYFIDQLCKDSEKPPAKELVIYPVSIRPTIKLNETVIWLLRYGADGLLYRTIEMDRYVVVIYPAREVTNRYYPYEYSKKLAQAIEKLYYTHDHSERGKLLQEYARSPFWLLSHWTLYIMREAKLVDFKDYLLELTSADQSMTAGGLAMLDNVLCEFSGKDWTDSKERLNLLKRSVNMKMEDWEASNVFNRIPYNNNEKLHIDVNTALNLYKIAAKNKDMPVKYRIYAIGDIGGVSKDNKLDTIGNEILIDLLKVEKDKDIIASIAIWLSVLASMNKDQINVVQSILDSTNDKKTADVIKEAIEKSKKALGDNAQQNPNHEPNPTVKYPDDPDFDPKNPTKKSKPSKEKSAESNESIWLFSAAGLFAVVLISFLSLKSAKK